MLIGYARVSKADGSQSLDLQRDALRAAGVDAGHVYHDFASGVRDDRPGLDSCVRALRTGDVLVAWKLDRLELKAKVTWEALRAEATMTEMATRSGVHPHLLATRKAKTRQPVLAGMSGYNARNFLGPGSA